MPQKHTVAERRNGIEAETIDSAADRLHVTTKTVRRWIAEGRLTAYRVGPRLVRVDAREVDDLLRPIPTATVA